ncbi:MAG: A/G-specific adenine glycosylase [Thermoanaerobaculia bacterium]|nr:A/G-specific adenine glycosylase [Thermoanaerobaculia bacterium]
MTAVPRPVRPEPAPAGSFVSVRRKLLAWSRAQARELPWRGTRDPYRIWVSEVMLQQTTVAAVLRRYDAFLNRFPNLGTLARAREESVLAAWSGLGYYARARNLWRAARQVVRDHAGRIPSDPESLRRLPGFGEYMSAVVPSLAFGARLPAADANVARVLSRIGEIPAPSGTAAQRRAVLSAAAKLMPRNDPGRFTAALMDLGQTVCLPRRPVCPRCPLREECGAFRAGSPERYPLRVHKPAVVSVAFAAAYVTEGGRALLRRRTDTLLRGMWEFPSAIGASPADAVERLRRDLHALGISLDASTSSGDAAHTVVNRRLAIRVFPGRIHPARASGLVSRSGYRWFGPRELSRAAIPTLTRKIGRAAGFLASQSDVS